MFDTLILTMLGRIRFSQPVVPFCHLRSQPFQWTDAILQ